MLTWVQFSEKKVTLNPVHTLKCPWGAARSSVPQPQVTDSTEQLPTQVWPGILLHLLGKGITLHCKWECCLQPR